MSKPAMGALVRYCGHHVAFLADIFEFSGVNVVNASFRPKSTQDFVDRLHAHPEKEIHYANATHQLTDFPMSGFWRPDLGVFVVPFDQVKEIKKRGASSLPAEVKLQR